MTWQDQNPYNQNNRNEPPITAAPSPSVTPQAQVIAGPKARHPRGLERLASLDTLIVDQQLESLEIFTGYETKNRYAVKDAQGHIVFYTAEESDSCDRMCCGSNRALQMRIIDTQMREVIRLDRPLNLIEQEMDVFSAGRKIGSIRQIWTLLTPSFSICNATGTTVFSIEGQAIGWTYKIFADNGQRRIGAIKKKWGGITRELFTDADSFGINFPADLDVEMKAVLLGACFLIDFMYHENN